MQIDIKKVLAYSTVSQLGYMVMGLGVGGWTAAVFHIFTHAFFKALLFLGAGSVSHSGSHHSFDMKKDMGGLRKYMPITFVTFIIGTLALMGMFPLAGFWSKDEIIANAGNNGYTAFMIVGLVGAFLTAAYMTRCMYLTFFGEYRGGQHEADVGEFGYEPVGEDIDAEVAELAHGTGHGAVALATGQRRPRGRARAQVEAGHARRPRACARRPRRRPRRPRRAARVAARAHDPAHDPVVPRRHRRLAEHARGASSPTRSSSSGSSPRSPSRRSTTRRSATSRRSSPSASW